jgi:hypothetical protein
MLPVKFISKRLMSYFLLPSKPVKPVRQLFPHVAGKNTSSTGWYGAAEKPRLLVDLGGVEPPSEQLILGHAKILVVNVLMIGQNTRFKAISRLSDAFSLLLWVANSLKL